MLSPFREPTEEERAKEQHLLDSLYEQFVASVASARGLSIEDVRALATGEVYTSADALDHGLIDATGDIEDAVDWVAAAAGIPPRLRLVRPRRGFRELLFGRASAALIEAAVLERLPNLLPRQRLVEVELRPVVAEQLARPVKVPHRSLTTGEGGELRRRLAHSRGCRRGCRRRTRSLGRHTVRLRHLQEGERVLGGLVDRENGACGARYGSPILTGRGLLGVIQKALDASLDTFARHGSRDDSRTAGRPACPR